MTEHLHCRAALLEEAAIAERAGGLWTQPQAAAVLGLGVSTLRQSSCPKKLLPGGGPKCQPIVRYVPAEVRAWIDAVDARNRGAFRRSPCARSWS